MERFAKIPFKQSWRIMPHGFWTFWIELMDIYGWYEWLGRGLIKRIIGQQRGKHGWRGLQRYRLSNHRG